MYNADMNIRATLVERPWAAIKRQRILRDKFLRWFLLGAALTCMTVWFLLITQLRPSDFAIPIAYTSGSEFSRGPWYYVYSYGLYSFIVTAGNIALAGYSFNKSRVASFLLVMSAIILNLFTIVITYTLLALQ